jgi:tetratricopeptide (TPR) repeat protein
MVEIAEIVEEDSAVAMKERGNAAFKNGEYAPACDLYTAAFEATSVNDSELRAVCLYNRACCRFHLSEFEASLSDCASALDYKPNYAKALLRRALAYEKLEKYADAVEDMEKLFEHENSYRTSHAKDYARILSERDKMFESEKSKMMKDLKSVGNSLLGHFGMSVDDFNFKQDPSTGNYSVSFSNKK